MKSPNLLVRIRNSSMDAIHIIPESVDKYSVLYLLETFSMGFLLEATAFVYI